jgi:hypothetical protein
MVFTKTKPSPEQLKVRDMLWEERNRAVEAARKAPTDAEWIWLLDEANATFLRKLNLAWGFKDEEGGRARALIHRRTAPLYVAIEQVVGKPLRPAQRDQVLTALAGWLEVALRAEKQGDESQKQLLEKATAKLLDEVRAVLQLTEEQAAQLRKPAGL